MMGQLPQTFIMFLFINPMGYMPRNMSRGQVRDILVDDGRGEM